MNGMNNLLKLGAAIVAPLALSACGIETEEDRLINAVKADLETKLKDPSSAQYRDITVEDGVVCGMVNAKNGFGGYDGFSPFWGGVDPEVGRPQGFLSEPNDVLLQTMCRGRI